MQVILHLSFVAVLAIMFAIFGIVMIGACIMQWRKDGEKEDEWP
jgi:hypothetical protein